MSAIANLTCLITLFSNLENIDKYGICQGGLCLCRENYEIQCATEEMIKSFCLPVSFFIFYIFFIISMALNEIAT